MRALFEIMGMCMVVYALIYGYKCIVTRWIRGGSPVVEDEVTDGKDTTKPRSK